MNINGKFQWYDEVEDMVTRYRGKVIGYTLYSTGCLQVLVMGQCYKKDGELKRPSGEWFDEDRLICVSEADFTIPVTSPGGDRLPPPQNSSS